MTIGSRKARKSVGLMMPAMLLPKFSEAAPEFCMSEKDRKLENSR